MFKLTALVAGTILKLCGGFGTRQTRHGYGYAPGNGTVPMPAAVPLAVRHTIVVPENYPQVAEGAD